MHMFHRSSDRIRSHIRKFLLLLQLHRNLEHLWVQRLLHLDMMYRILLTHSDRIDSYCDKRNHEQH